MIDSYLILIDLRKLLHQNRTLFLKHSIRVRKFTCKQTMDKYNKGGEAKRPLVLQYYISSFIPYSKKNRTMGQD